jgi:predicted esterase
MELAANQGGCGPRVYLMTDAITASRAGRLVVGLALFAVATSARAETFTLKNGLMVSGTPGKISSIGADPLKTVGATDLKQVFLIDNQLTRTFFGTNQVAAIATPPPVTAEKFLIQQRVAVAGGAVGGVGPIIRVTPFDEWGRRIFSMNTVKGQVDIVQGITEITPTYTKVEAIQGKGNFVWTMRIATSSIPRATLSKILYHEIDPKNSDQRLKIVRLYLQSERIADARAELEQLIKDFPELDRLKDQVKSLQQMSALRILKEVELRKSAGQYQRAVVVLQQFPQQGIAGETLLQVREMLAELADLQTQGVNVQGLLQANLAAVKDDKVRAELQPIVDEITADLNVNTLDRMADFLRLANDPTLSAEQKLSLAISGWLLGNGSGLDNVAVSKSLVEVRDMVRQYLASTRKPERDNILTQLESQEGATPAYIAKLIAHMKPPLEKTVLLDAVDPGDAAAVLGLPAEEKSAASPSAAEKPVAAPAAPATETKAGGCDPDDEPPAAKKDADLNLGKKAAPMPGILDDDPIPARPIAGAKPAAKAPPAEPPAKPEAPPEAPTGPVEATGIPGMFEIAVAGLPEDPQIKYYLQLPPEYDPYRRYPCIVTLNGAGTTPQQQIDWWAGAYNADVQNRFGQANRHGYIVLAPRWTREHQRSYEYTAREHAAALYTLRDACKRFSIDTDRVFLSGHSMGGDAAWDIGLAHPDLFAGVIPIVATADKYVKHRYRENAKYVPLYFVCGEKDGNKLTLNADEWDHYLTRIGYDTMVVQYQGRGHEHFHDEVQRLFDWMNLHKRNFYPKDFTVYSMRPWDNFFWWAETSKPKPANVVLPAAWGANARAGEVDANVLATNGVRVSSTAEKVTVWLSPEIVDFSAKMSITINNKRVPSPGPSIVTLLEDARTRGDRQHPFWAKASN